MVGYVAGADAPGTLVTCRDARDSGKVLPGRGADCDSALEAASPLGTSVCTSLRSRVGAPREGSSVRRISTCPAKLGRGRPQPGRMPGDDGIAGTGTVAPARGPCAPGTAHGRAPLATDCQGDAGEERSRTQLSGHGVLLQKAAPGRPGIIRAAGVSVPCRCLWGSRTRPPSLNWDFTRLARIR
jgi:hypothetical protein